MSQRVSLCPSGFDGGDGWSIFPLVNSTHSISLPVLLYIKPPLFGTLFFHVYIFMFEQFSLNLTEKAQRGVHGWCLCFGHGDDPYVLALSSSYWPLLRFVFVYSYVRLPFSRGTKACSNVVLDLNEKKSILAFYIFISFSFNFTRVWAANISFRAMIGKKKQQQKNIILDLPRNRCRRNKKIRQCI